MITLLKLKSYTKLINHVYVYIILLIKELSDSNEESKIKFFREIIGESFNGTSNNSFPLKI